ncbi:AAA family ATPase [Aliikangiella marina]|uniref:AAA family ATPase n=1 Tax=Aliikangiella marina TaxID=1712262 RepID=A0A545TBP7_9GAMM|nr:AAA family ATPase [Aliikangiella marina]TQV74629.1 AAA family ATPase [Aliikangiella marina]
MSYVSLHKSQLLDSLENQVLYADLCTVVIGEEGTGKSFFLEQLNQRMQGQTEVSQIEAADEMSVAQLEKSIGLQLDLSWNEADNLIDRVANRFDRRVLLTVDNAQLLPNTCLEFLMMLVAEQLSSKAVKIFVVLAGDARLAKKLNETSTLVNNPNICVVFELEPIKKNETKALIADFQSIDEGTVDALYDEQKLDYLWQLSKGNPGDLNYQLNRWLAETNKPAPKLEENTVSKKYLMGVTYLMLALLLAGVLIYQDDINEFIAPQENTISDPRSQEVLSLPENRSDLTQVSDSTSGNTGESLNSNQSSRMNQESENQESENQENENQGNEAQNETATTTLEAKKEPQIDKVSSQTKNRVEESLDKNDTTDIRVAESQQETDSKNEPSKSQTRESSEPPRTETNEIESPADNINSNQSSETGKAQLTADERKLLTYLDSQHTLQWVGVSNLQAAEQFRDSHPLASQMLIFRRLQGGKYLFLVVSGQFNSRTDADNARVIYGQRNYPGKPWIKSINAIKQEINTIPQ